MIALLRWLNTFRTLLERKLKEHHANYTAAKLALQDVQRAEST